MATEKRLIDANALITTIQGTASEVARTAPYDPDWFTRLAQRQFEILGIIDKTPTVDAVEVVHGEWIWTKDGEADWQQYWVCSECSDVTFFRTNYCPNCGAKMMEGDGNA